MPAVIEWLRVFDVQREACVNTHVDHKTRIVSGAILRDSISALETARLCAKMLLTENPRANLDSYEDELTSPKLMPAILIPVTSLWDET